MWERNISWLPSAHTLTGDQTLYPEPETPSVCGTTPNKLSPTGQPIFYFLFLVTNYMINFCEQFVDLEEGCVFPIL